MKKAYYIETFGCQMNVHDSEKIAGILKKDGYTEADNPQDADIIVFNTCSIRAKAEQKFFSKLGRLKTLKKRNPLLKIAVAGCIAQQAGAKILQRAPYIDYVLGPQNLHLLTQISTLRKYSVARDDNPVLAETDFCVDRKDRIKAWVTIMYGCNNFCSYCVVPYTRGREKSRPSGKIVDEIKELAGEGFKEITLLGQNVNSYRSDLDFMGLLYKINEIQGIERIRFVTSHPKDLSNDLIHAMRDLDKVCEHIHLPLQSGSTRILKLMNRNYGYEDYLRQIDLLRKTIPSISITTDIIAGFPQESEEDHSLTMRALKDIGFDGIFAFNYSPRPGTKASEFTGHIDEDVSSRRLYEILDLQTAITDQKNKELEDTIQEVLIEEEVVNTKGRVFTGRTRSNKIVNVTLIGQVGTGDTVNVRIIKTNRHSMEAVVLST